MLAVDCIVTARDFTQCLPTHLFNPHGSCSFNLKSNTLQPEPFPQPQESETIYCLCTAPFHRAASCFPPKSVIPTLMKCCLLVTVSLCAVDRPVSVLSMTKSNLFYSPVLLGALQEGTALGFHWFPHSCP